MTTVDGVVAWVSGRSIGVSDVDALEAELRAGPVAATLPRVGTGEGRQLRRWLVQVLVAERLVAAEARARGLGDGPDLVELAPDRAALLGLGSVAADLLTRSAVARAVFVAVTADVVVEEERVRRYYVANPEGFRVPERRVVRHAIAASAAPVDPAGRPLRTLRRGELAGRVEEALFAAAPGEVVGPVRDSLGWHTVQVVEVRPGRVRPFEEVRDEIAGRLLAAARRRAFTAWLDRHAVAEVRLAPGFEHPGDPGQPDNTHRH
ncbi:peptidylprolyl isomerase [Actinophytocola sp.]|uniref:peptidylprolyl isomerase n=1 Tax=Actinophytocola sp. TaxID=1872138 RepID=UPI002EDB9305